MSGTPEDRKAELRDWLEGLTAEPPEGLEEAGKFRELAGELFDDEHLDGEQYSAVYEVARALKEPGMPKVADLARRALRMIA